MKKSKKKGFRPGYDRATQFQLHTLMLPGTILMLMFSVVPLFGLLLAFKNYKVIEGIKGVFTSPWYGFQNFKIIFGNFDFRRMLTNTLGINLIGNLVGILAAIGFALFINEIAHAKFKSVVQTVTYMPHFISWVVFGSIIITLLSGDGGLFNQILLKLGVIKTPIVFMAQPKYFWAIAILSNLVKELGWSTILYTAAISGVDQELYEAAVMDGAVGWKLFVTVIFPLLKPALATTGVLNFMWVWNELQIPMYLLNSAAKWTLPLSVYNFYGQFSRSWNLVCADVVLVSLPVVIVYIFAQKWVIAGMTAGAVKG